MIVSITYKRLIHCRRLPSTHFLAGLTITRTRMSTAATKRDPNTLSNYDKFRSKHIVANFELDFVRKGLKGTVDVSLEAVSPANEIVLDTSFLDVQDVTIDGSKAKWALEDRSEPYGSPLKIQVGGNVDIGKKVTVSIKVETTDKCTALQWLSPDQTSNKKHPYMFSQCQAIHARSIIPCQDTPDVKSTVDFNLRSPLPVVASGLPTGSHSYEHGAKGQPGTLLYTFKQTTPMPAYLFALASGDLASASIGPRSLVVTGPEELAAAKWEFENDMDRFLDAAEKILQPVGYAWTTYNVLVLPPSFPYGGMENPVFTFATPTLISGDRENVDVIAHELAHSWSGNLVSNCSWEHFWLNEGWTVYLERRIQAEIHGEKQRDFSAIIGWKALTDSVNNFGADHKFTKLITDLKGEDPDDAFSSIPYEKGSTFLLHLEKLVGKAKFDKFIPHYFGKYAGKSLDSFEFRQTITDFFANDSDASKKLAELDWDGWFYNPGLPPKPNFDTSLVDMCFALAGKWEARAQGSGFQPQESDIKGWSSSQMVVLLEQCEEFATPLRPEDTQAMGKVYKLNQTNNAELSARFFRLALGAGDKSACQPTAELLGKVGRMKFVRPLYRALKAVDNDLAQATFKKNESFYHPICAQMVRKDLEQKSAV